MVLHSVKEFYQLEYIHLALHIMTETFTFADLNYIEHIDIATYKHVIYIETIHDLAKQQQQQQKQQKN